MQLSFAADRSLSFDDLYGGESVVNPATDVITFTSQWWPIAGWNFATVLMASFTGDVESISFQSSNWITPGEEGAFPKEAPFPSITLEEVTLIGFFETEEEALTMEALFPTGDNTVDAENRVITFVSNWSPVIWSFDPAKDKDTYVGVELSFDKPITYTFLQLKIEYVGSEDAEFFSLAEGSQAISIPFTDDVKSIALQNSQWDGNEPKTAPFPSLTIVKSYLLKKVKTSIPVIEDTDDNGLVDVYNISGIKILNQVSKDDAINSLSNGIYIMNNKKVLLKK